MNNALLTGGIQVISTVQTPETLAQFGDTAKYQVIHGTTNGEVMMTMNNTRNRWTTSGSGRRSTTPWTSTPS